MHFDVSTLVECTAVLITLKGINYRDIYSSVSKERDQQNINMHYKREGLECFATALPFSKKKNFLVNGPEAYKSVE